jgi:hypothetical protein
MQENNHFYQAYNLFSSSYADGDNEAKKLSHFAAAQIE